VLTFDAVSVGFRLAGKAEPAIIIDPPSLRFDRREVAQGVAKHFTLSSRLPIDWQTLSVTSSSSCAQLALVPAGPGAGRFSVRFSIPRGEGDVAASLMVAARVRESSPQVPGFMVSATAYAFAEHPVALAWKPELVAIRFNRAKQSGRGQLALWGEDLAGGGGAIESVSCEGYRVEHAARHSAGDVVMVDLTFSGGPPEPSTSQKTLVLRLAGREPIRIPVVLSSPE
jgi:hypothetical protein